MNVDSLILRQNKFILCSISVIALVSAGVAISIFLDDIAVFPVIVILSSLSVLFIIKPKWLLYFYMLFFVFSEVSAGHFFIQPSLSNGFIALALLIIILQSVTKKRDIVEILKSSKQNRLLIGIFVLFIVEILSAVLNNSYRALLTRLAQVIILIFFSLRVHDKTTLWRVFWLGAISVGILSILTILSGFNLNPIGYRASHNWGGAPWEAYIPRSIGISQLSGGLHGIFILSFLPFVILLTVNQNKLKIRWTVKIISALISIFGILALLFASFRSGWLGLMVSLFCLVLFHVRFSRISIRNKMVVLLLLTCFIVLTLSPFITDIYNNLYNIIFTVRFQGVDARLLQYQFAINRMASSPISIHHVLGYGYDGFSSSFMEYVMRMGNNNPELYPWLHNYYLGLIYASGWLGFIIYAILFFYIMQNLYRKAASPDYFARVINSAIFSALAGISVILFFTAETSGLHIVWILIASSAFVNKRKLNSIIKDK